MNEALRGRTLPGRHREPSKNSRTNSSRSLVGCSGVMLVVTTGATSPETNGRFSAGTSGAGLAPALPVATGLAAAAATRAPTEIEARQAVLARRRVRDGRWQLRIRPLRGRGPARPA
ncbi:MAG: hypothetical protein M3455_09340, partial [Actinomycetota bacterium]|nr:hypothetical protein [Actinomycetota bacterium]